MCISVRALLLFIFVAASVVAAASSEFVARYVPIGTSGSTSLLAVDASGNFFIVGTVTEPSGRPQIRAIKTDSQGNLLASFDFGGSSFEFPDAPSGAAIDPQGNLVIVGNTSSQDFPLVGPPISKITGGGFIMKLDSRLTQIMFSTLLGGTINAVTLDAAGNIYMTGSTGASDFPTTPGAFQTAGPTFYPEFGGPTYAFLTEISPDASSIVYSTFFGSAGVICNDGSACVGEFGLTGGTAIAVDDTGTVVIGGTTTADNLPITPGTLGQQCGCFVDRTQGSAVSSSFLANFAPGGKQLNWATYIALAEPNEGPSGESDLSIDTLAIDAEGNVVFGGASSSGLTTTTGALQGSYPGANPYAQIDSGFVAKVNRSATSYVFSTYFGQTVFGSPDGVTALLLDAQGDIWLTGGSDPGLLPFSSSTPLLGSTYVAELSADGSSVMDGITASANAAGQAIVITPNGTPAVLGPAGSLLLDLPGQPASLVGIENSAGIQVSSNVAPNELLSLFGVGLGPANELGGQVVNGALTTSLGGVQVLFNNVAAPLLFVGPNQINAIVPSGVFGRDTASVQVVTPNGTLTGPTLSVVPSEPEVFQNGPPTPTGGSAIALNQDGSLNSASNPAAGGSIVTVWATGAGNPYGGVDGLIATGPYGGALPVSVLNGLDSLEVLYAGDAPGLVIGVLQVNFRLPENLSGLDIDQFTCQLQIGAAVSSLFSVYVTP